MATVALLVFRVVLAVRDVDTLLLSFPHAFLSLLFCLTVKYKGRSSCYGIQSIYVLSVKYKNKLWIICQSRISLPIFGRNPSEKKRKIRIKNFCGGVVDVDSFKAEETKDSFKTFLLRDTNVF
jgi:hypothetical protein